MENRADVEFRKLAERQKMPLPRDYTPAPWFRRSMLERLEKNPDDY